MANRGPALLLVVKFFRLLWSVKAVVQEGCPRNVSFSLLDILKLFSLTLCKLY